MQSIKAQSLPLFNNLKVRMNSVGTAYADYYSFCKRLVSLSRYGAFKCLSRFGIMNMPLMVRVFSNTLMLLNLKVSIKIL